jgi:hypothetical protein
VSFDWTGEDATGTGAIACPQSFRLLAPATKLSILSAIFPE